jgi:hypothetical protein
VQEEKAGPHGSKIKKGQKRKKREKKVIINDRKEEKKSPFLSSQKTKTPVICLKGY